MSIRLRRPAALITTTAAVATTMVLTACSGGASDVVGGSAGAATANQAGQAGAGGTVNLYAYSTAKPAFDKLIAGFNATPAGQGVTFQASYGASGDQSRKVQSGATAGFVDFSVEPDMTRLVDAGLVDKSWNAAANKGIPFGSVVTMVVRKGNPKGIKDWDDLLKPGVEVVTPNPFSSGSAKWNLLAPYSAKSQGGTDDAAGLGYVNTLITQHVKTQPKSAREASESFLQGSGDVLLSYENEALLLERNGDPVEHVTPPTTFKIENPAAVVSKSGNPTAAKAFNDYLYTADAQNRIAEAGFRPVDESILAKYASTFPTPTKLYAIADLGGWKKVDAAMFAKDTGSVAKIYDAATK